MGREAVIEQRHRRRMQASGMVADSNQAVALAESLGGKQSQRGSGDIGCRWYIYRRPNLEDEGSSYEFFA